MKLTIHPLPEFEPPKPTYTLELTHAQLVRLAWLSYWHEPIPATFYSGLPDDIQDEVGTASNRTLPTTSAPSPWVEPVPDQPTPVFSRCPAKQGMAPCQRPAGHEGWHRFVDCWPGL